MEKTWMNVCNPGYFGAKRDEIFREYDLVYGKGNWKIAWRYDRLTLDFIGVCAFYEQAYHVFLKSPAGAPILAQLITEACDVYDDRVSNVESGLDYTKQETDRTHIQDIAIRRVVKRMGLTFSGAVLIRIRDKDGDHPLSKALSPGRVPFHRPELILPRPTTRKKQWWNDGSVEDFYQNNKVLQVLLPTMPPAPSAG